jgi:hypothetical protein
MTAYIPTVGRFYSVSEDGIVLESKYIEHNGQTLDSVLANLIPATGENTNIKFDLYFEKSSWSLQYSHPCYRIKLNEMHLQNYIMEGVYMLDTNKNFGKNYKSVPVEKRILSNEDILLTAHEPFEGFVRFKK